MKSTTLLGLACCVALAATPAVSFAHAASPSASQPWQDAGLFSADQLDNLLAPIALYPDPLLAQVLPAATYPDQIAAAEQWERAGNNPQGVDGTDWDVSIKAVAHYPTVLAKLANQPDWTTSLGQAYVDQPDDVMASVQRLRHLAREEGNLVSNQQQQVLLSGSYIQIDPIQPQYLYVPTYDPSAIYVRRGNFLSFSAGLAIGAWLNYDFNWGSHQVYYTGWQGGGWIARSRPMVQVNNTTYVNNRYSTVQVNRTVVNQRVNYTALNSVHSVHNNVNYNNVAARAPAAANRAVAGRPATAAATPAARAEARPTPAAEPARTAPSPTRGRTGANGSGGTSG